MPESEVMKKVVVNATVEGGILLHEGHSDPLCRSYTSYRRDITAKELVI
jgi:hypothetical protein